MQRRLPLTIELNKAAQKRLDYVGFYPKQIVRCHSDVIASLDSDIKVVFSFAVDGQYLAVVSLAADMELSLVCQRCGKPFKHSLHIENKFSPVRSDKQAQMLPEEYDPIELNESGEVDLLALVESEIILSLPIIPVEDITYCEIPESGWRFGEIPEDAKGANPFARLADLKNN